MGATMRFPNAYEPKKVFGIIKWKSEYGWEAFDYLMTMLAHSYTSIVDMQRYYGFEVHPDILKEIAEESDMVCDHIDVMDELLADGTEITSENYIDYMTYNPSFQGSDAGFEVFDDEDK